MALVFVQRYAPSGGIAAGTGTQTVTNTLTLADPTIVEIDPTLFTTAGTYTIFTYGTLSPSNAVALGYLYAAGVGLPAGDLTGTGFTSAVFADTGSAITVTLS